MQKHGKIIKFCRLSLVDVDVYIVCVDLSVVDVDIYILL